MRWGENGRVLRFDKFGGAIVVQCSDRPHAYRWYFRVVNGSLLIVSGYAESRALARRAAEYAIELRKRA